MLAIVAYFCLVVTPGCAIAIAIRPSIYRRPILLLATAPAFAYALSFASTAVLDSFGAGPWPGLLIANGVAVVAGAVRFGIHAHRSGRDQTGEDQAGGNQAGGNDARDHLSDEIRLAHLLLGAAILLGALMWLAPGKPSVPMNGDVQNHAHFITRIIEEDSVDPSVVIAENPIGSSPAASFYPLAAHSTIAVAQMATTQSIPDLLITWPMLSAILSFPCGIFVLARRLMPGRELVAGLASLVASVGAEFPYFPMYWGGVPFLIAMSLVPGVVALALDAVDSREWSLYTLAAIATAGTVFAHTSEIAVLAVILSCLALHDILNARKAVPLENANSLRRVVGSWGVFAGACALLLAPTLAAMLGATSENSGYEIVADNGFAAAVSTLLGGSTQPIIGLLGLAGIAIVIVNRRSSPPGRMRGALWALGVFALLLLSTLLGGAVWDLLRSVTVPWYKSWWRLTYNLAILFPLFAAVALDTTRMAIARSGRYHTRTYLIGISVLAVVLLAPSAWKTLGRTGVHGQSL
ncbi:MAG TPA: DUF6541 family protein, partial [Microthrixaceae bacterium]|nr:DUF6541 family protein [Microthrixaceae bacterium]